MRPGEEAAVPQAERHPVLVHAPLFLGDEALHLLDGAVEKRDLTLEGPPLGGERPPCQRSGAGDGGRLFLLEPLQPRLRVPLQGAPHDLAHLVLRDVLGQPTQLDGVVGHSDSVLVHAARHGLNVAAQLGGQQQQQQDGETAVD